MGLGKLCTVINRYKRFSLYYYCYDIFNTTILSYSSVRESKSPPLSIDPSPRKYLLLYTLSKGRTRQFCTFSLDTSPPRPFSPLKVSRRVTELKNQFSLAHGVFTCWVEYNIIYSTTRCDRTTSFDMGKKLKGVWQKCKKMCVPECLNDVLLIIAHNYEGCTPSPLNSNIAERYL